MKTAASYLCGNRICFSGFWIESLKEQNLFELEIYHHILKYIKIEKIF